MTDRDTLEMMNRCKQEIKDLRARRADAEPKARAYESIATILDLLPKRSQGYGLDVVYTLEKEIEKLKNQMAEAKQAEASNADA